MNESQKRYWDSSCFICFLNKDEEDRRMICEDNLKHAKSGAIQIWTSTWTIVEVVRPKRHGSAPLPDWAGKAIEAIEKEHPNAKQELETLWRRYQSNDPATKLTPEQIEKIQGMFEWNFIRKINLDERVATKAVSLCRDYGLKPADAVHAASALVAKVSVLQRWDRDFEKVKALITVEEPNRMSAQDDLFSNSAIGPAPSDFESEKAKAADEAGLSENGS